MATTVVGDIRTYTVVFHHRTVVDGTSFVEIDTTSLSIGGVVGNDTGRSKRREVVGTVGSRNGFAGVFAW